MKQHTTAVVVIALFAAAIPGNASAQNGSNLIVPGQSIGQTHLGRFANDLRDVQPRNGVTIQLIRVTSPWYHTANGISTGKTLSQILP
jgi:hypothetical protein